MSNVHKEFVSAYPVPNARLVESGTDVVKISLLQGRKEKQSKAYE